jgi:hypothetical protein
MEDIDATADDNTSRDAVDDEEISEVAHEVALTHLVPAAEARLGRDAVTKVCHCYKLTTRTLMQHLTDYKAG